MIAARRDRAFAAAIAAADLIVADGVGVMLAARALGGGWGAVGRVTGMDLVEWLAGPAAAPTFLLGGKPGVGARAAAMLADRFPAARVAGYWEGGSADEADDVRSVARIAAAGARAVLVAYGAPAQVLWVERNRFALASSGVRAAIGVGGVMDYLAGTVPRAPAWMRALGLEWLYRLMRQPWRWRRQLALPRFAARIAWETPRRRGTTGRRHAGTHGA